MTAQRSGKLNIHGKRNEQHFGFVRNAMCWKMHWQHRHRQIKRTICIAQSWNKHFPLLSHTLTDSHSPSASVSSCLDRACSPPIGNLASGRTLFTLSNCCGNSTSQHPLCPQPSVSPQACSQDPHPALHMTDDPFLHPDTWWASGGRRTMRGQQDEIRLDLETKFCLTHLVLVFKSPRPAAMAIERSVDFGKTWEALKVFAYNCSLEFGLPDDFNQPGSPCTSRYTDAAPCTGGEVEDIWI